jgi:hypothetical protein
MIGMIALAGIIVRNSILLVDFVNQQVDEGVDFQEAVIRAGAVRAKPIALTAVAAMLGAFFILDDPIFNGLAVTLIFGILVSTLLTLVVIPVLYYASLRDLAPIVVVIAVFQIFVIKQPVDGFLSLVFGGLLVVMGLAFFIFGLRLALFPIGENLAHALARKGSAAWLFTFAFVLGFGTTIAEPALLAVANEAAEVAVGAGVIGNTEADIENYALGLRLVVALSVGVALMLGVLRILTNW